MKNEEFRFRKYLSDSRQFAQKSQRDDLSIIHDP